MSKARKTPKEEMPVVTKPDFFLKKYTGQLMVIGVFLMMLAVSSYTKHAPISGSAHASKKLIAVASPSATPIIGTPTPTNTPTPTPYSGYCLYVPVLFYHHIQPQADAVAKGQTSLSVDNGIFDQQMAYVAQSGYTTITAKQLVDALITKSPLPAKPLVITLDDGYKDNYTYAHPVIQKYGLTANLMLASGLVGGADYLTWDMVSDMKNSGRWYFTNHTWSHYSLGQGDDAKITYEVQTAKQQIEAHTGQPTNVFTYPYGTFTPHSVELLKSLGVQGAYSTIGGSMQCDSILYQLRRTRIGNSSLSAYGF